MRLKITSITFLFIASFCGGLEAQELPVGLLSWEPNANGQPPYATFIASDGTLTQITGSSLPAQGTIFSVAMNGSGAGIIGGEDLTGSSPPYAALVSRTGAMTPLSGTSFPTAGSILSVDINNSGVGLIGGEDGIGSAPAYAALVASDGTLTQLSGVGFPSANGSIKTVAINDSGIGLIGGNNDFLLDAYVARVSPDGTLTQLSGAGLPDEGDILSVAINHWGAGIIGGEITSSLAGYAALVSPNGSLTQLSGSGFPSVRGEILSVAINDSGAGIIGGKNQSTASAYAALVASNGSLTQLSGANFPLIAGIINSVAINDSGSGIIGGRDTDSGSAYAALVAPSGVLTELSGSGFPSITGTITSVAINNEGVGLIGGSDLTGSEAAYLALVAPNGTLSQLTGGGLPLTSGVISDLAILKAVTPRSFGSYLSAINTQLAAMSTLESHITIRSRLLNKKSQTKSAVAHAREAQNFQNATEHFSKSDLIQTCALENQHAFRSDFGNQKGENDATIALLKARRLYQREESSSKQKPAQETNSCVWVAPFGNYIHQAAQGNNPSSTNEMIGILTAFDYEASNFLVGGGLGYAFNYIHYGASQGHSKINEEMAFAYGSYSERNCWVNVALWGGLYQFENKRHTLSSFTSSAQTHGWILSPHVEVATPFDIRGNDQFSIEPFAMFDWVNSWQHHFKEKGSSSLNLVMDNHYGSLLRSEVGLRFYEELRCNAGKLLFKEKLSYVNQAPFHFDPVKTAFVGSASSFSIAIGNSKVQNLFGIEFQTLFSPSNPMYPYISLDFQGTFNGSYQSYFMGLEVGKVF